MSEKEGFTSPFSSSSPPHPPPLSVDTSHAPHSPSSPSPAFSPPLHSSYSNYAYDHSHSPPNVPHVSPLPPVISPPTSPVPSLSPVALPPPLGGEGASSSSPPPYGTMSPPPSPRSFPSSPCSSPRDPRGGLVSSAQAHLIRSAKEKISSAEDHPIVSLSFLQDNKSGHLATYVFNIPKSRLEVYKHHFKSAKDVIPATRPAPNDTIEFSLITNFTVTPVTTTTNKIETTIQQVSIYGGSSMLASLKLVHMCQLDPLSEILRLIIDGGDVMTYFQSRPTLCLKKGMTTIRLKKEDKKVYTVVTVRTMSIYLQQYESIPMISLPLPILELTKNEAGLNVQAVGSTPIPPLQFIFDTMDLNGRADIPQADRDREMAKREKERDIWYHAIRKATRIVPGEVLTVIELQNDIVAHYGLPLEKARLPCLSLLRKLWSFLRLKEEFNEDDFSSPHWKDLGFQSSTPLQDTKRVGMLGLRYLSYYGERWPDLVHDKIKLARDKKAAEKRYALAFVAILITDLLTSLVGLHPNREGQVQKFPSSFPMFFHHSLNPKMFDELFCWGMHVFDLLWDDQPKKGRRVELVMSQLKERMGQKLKQPPVHGGFEMLFGEENKVLKSRAAKRNDLAKTKKVLVSLYPELVSHLIATDAHLAMAINKASPHSMSHSLSLRIQKLLTQNGVLVPNLYNLVRLEISATLSGTTLFRENNICTYLLTSFTKELAKTSGYLEVIRPTVLELISSGKSFDFSGRNKESQEVIEENQANVVEYVEKFLHSIINSLNIMPIEFRILANVLQQTVLTKFPECRHSVVGSFLFLRLLCPLIVTPPTEWEGVPDPIPLNQKKGLVLMSKVLQNLSNGTSLRETNTDFINKWLDKSREKLQNFFDAMAEPVEGAGVVGGGEKAVETIVMDFDDVLHLHSFLHSHLLQVDEAIRTHLPIATKRLQSLVLLLVKLPSGIEPFLETASS